MRKLFYLFLFVLLTKVASTQTDSLWVALFSIPAQGAPFFTTDQILQTYLVSHDQELIKYSAEGKEQFRYNNRRLGKLVRVDVSNTFSLLLYYSDYQTAIILDRTLSKISEWNLLSFGFLNVTAVATSTDNQLWIYDIGDQRLKKIGANGNVLTQSDNLLQVLDFSLQPACLLAYGNYVYLSDPAHGIVVFDAIGQYHGLIPMQGLTDFQVLSDAGDVLYQKEGALWRYGLQMPAPERIALPAEIAADARLQLQRGRLFSLSQDTLSVYGRKE